MTGIEQQHNSQASCRKCKFFYITWDKSFPYGCKAMGFKSKSLPGMITRQVSHSDCLSYEEKEQPKKGD